MFDAIARRYDFLNHVLSLGLDAGWRRTTIRALGLSTGSRVLDLATGTGDLAIAALRMVPDSTVVGVDLSHNMLEIGIEKARLSGLADRTSFQLGDAQYLGFVDDSFAAATIAFGIRNVPDRARALREMARVVRPGGRVGILELLEPKEGVLGTPARLYVRNIVPRIGAMLSGAKEYRYLQESIAAFPRPEAFAKIMEESGLKVEKVKQLSFGACCLYVGQV